MSYTAKVSYAGPPDRPPHFIDTETDVDALLELLLAGPDGPWSSARLYLVDRPLRDGQWPDHELKLGVNAPDRLAALHYWQDDDFDNAAYTCGNRVSDEPVGFVYFGDSQEFPRDCELPLASVREALVEWLRTGERPTCVRWKTYAGPVYVG